MMMLCHEHDDDPEMRPKPISPEQRENVTAHMVAGLLGAYRYFREHRQDYASTHLSLGAALPRLAGMIRVCAVRERNTRDAAVG